MSLCCKQGRQSGRSSKHSTRVEHLRMTVFKIAHRERERERERGTKDSSIQNREQYNQPHKEVTRSLYIVTNLGQLPFMLITQMTQNLSYTKG